MEEIIASGKADVVEMARNKCLSMFFFSPEALKIKVQTACVHPRNIL